MDEKIIKLTTDNESDKKDSNMGKTVKQTNEKIVGSNGDLDEAAIGFKEKGNLKKQPSDTEDPKNPDSEYQQKKLDKKIVGTIPESDKETKPISEQQNYTKKHNYGNAIPSKYASDIPKGILLEYRIKRLVFNLGYFPRTDIDLKTSYDEAADKITDLDIYGIYVHKNFTTTTLWADCKAGGVKIHDRLSWIKGVMSAIQINDVLFVAGRVRTSVKQYARKSGIQILDLHIIEKLERDYGIESDDWRGSWNPNTQFNKIINLSRVSIPTNDLYKKIAQFISSDYWVMDNYSRAKKSLTALYELSSIVSISISDAQLNVIKWAIFELIVMFLLAVLNISKDLYYFSDTEKKESIYEGLIAGDVPNKIRAEIFDAAVRYAYSSFKKQIPDFKEQLMMPKINLNPPSYSDSFIDLLLRITNKPSYYFDILRFMDFILMEYDLNNKPYNESELRIIFSNYDNVLVGSKTLLHFICHTTNLSRALFSILN